MRPIFSIITVVYNAFETIESTILSVIHQENASYEYIVIDGGSQDGTLTIINRYREKIHQFVSEPDSGIYDAMNKAIDIAKGSYLYFLGADDKLFDHQILSKIEKSFFNLNSPPDIILGRVRYNRGLVVSPSFSQKLLLHNSIHHQGTFYLSKWFARFRYDSSLKTVADYELNLILFLNRKTVVPRFTSEIISICSEGGVSRSLLKAVRRETRIVRSKHINGVFEVLLEILFRIKFMIWHVRHKYL